MEDDKKLKIDITAIALAIIPVTFGMVQGDVWLGRILIGSGTLILLIYFVITLFRKRKGTTENIDIEKVKEEYKQELIDKKLYREPKLSTELLRHSIFNTILDWIITLKVQLQNSKSIKQKSIDLFLLIVISVVKNKVKEFIDKNADRIDSNDITLLDDFIVTFINSIMPSCEETARLSGIPSAFNSKFNEYNKNNILIFISLAKKLQDPENDSIFNYNKFHLILNQLNSLLFNLFQNADEMNLQLNGGLDGIMKDVVLTFDVKDFN